jgi:hypothetical protein
MEIDYLKLHIMELTAELQNKSMHMISGNSIKNFTVTLNKINDMT